jgi:hypothetical protein
MIVGWDDTDWPRLRTTDWIVVVVKSEPNRRRTRVREIDGEEEPTENEGLFFLRKGLCFLEVETFEKLDFSNMKSFF